MSRLVYQTAHKTVKDPFKIYIKKIRSDKNDFIFYIDSSLGIHTASIYRPSENKSLPEILKSVFNSCVQDLDNKGTSYFFQKFRVVFNQENRIEGNAQYSFKKDQDYASGYHSFCMINDSVSQTVPMSQEEINMFFEAFIVLRNSTEVANL